MTQTTATAYDARIRPTRNYVIHHIGLSTNIGTDEQGRKFLALGRDVASQSLAEEIAAGLAKLADSWRNSTADDVQSTSKYGERPEHAEALAANRRKTAAEIDGWMALPGEILVVCYAEYGFDDYLTPLDYFRQD